MIRSGQVTVASAGTAVQASTDTAERVYFLRAHPDNTGNIAIGNDGSDDVTVDNGLILKNTDPPIRVACRLSDIYVDVATGGDKLCWFTVVM